MSETNAVTWGSTHGEVPGESVIQVEKALGIKFPEDFVECAVKNHGGYPSRDVFDFVNHEGAVFNRLLSFNPEKKTYILNVYNWIRDRLVEGIYPFADDPFGNFICFYYRNPEDKAPAIVFWDHEIAYEDPEKAISPVCNTFTELLSKLYTDE